jgi:hypothetical protein
MREVYERMYFSSLHLTRCHFQHSRFTITRVSVNESFRKEFVSMSESEEAKKKAVTTYNAASDYYEGVAEV